MQVRPYNPNMCRSFFGLSAVISVNAPSEVPLKADEAVRRRVDGAVEQNKPGYM